ncbi:hypothetical protein CJF31_00009681 [Rutstroemia sp. NJR-2017a BVV2]|nr:hypothetical protein CJF31_00009681 [Rutstroemia sp. NJR-2017a BVV2]
MHPVPRITEVDRVRVGCVIRRPEQRQDIKRLSRTLRSNIPILSTRHGTIRRRR